MCTLCVQSYRLDDLSNVSIFIPLDLHIRDSRGSTGSSDGNSKSSKLSSFFEHQFFNPFSKSTSASNGPTTMTYGCCYNIFQHSILSCCSDLFLLWCFIIFFLATGITRTKQTAQRTSKKIQYLIIQLSGEDRRLLLLEAVQVVSKGLAAFSFFCLFS